MVILLLPLTLAEGSSGAELPQLVGTVGPGFTIDLADASGAHVATVPAGRYELLVHDLSEMHNFVLGSKATGERFVDSGVEFVGDKTVTIDLVAGRYVYACSPHFETMNGSLTVLAAPEPPVKALTARVGARTVTMSATRLSAGRYRLTVLDRSSVRNFHIVGPGVNRRTTRAFAGTATWLLQLKRGTYRFGSDPILSGKLVVG